MGQDGTNTSVGQERKAEVQNNPPMDFDQIVAASLHIAQQDYIHSQWVEQQEPRLVPMEMTRGDELKLQFIRQQKCLLWVGYCDMYPTFSRKVMLTARVFLAIQSVLLMLGVLVGLFSPQLSVSRLAMGVFEMALLALIIGATVRASGVSRLCYYELRGLMSSNIASLVELVIILLHTPRFNTGGIMGFWVA